MGLLDESAPALRGKDDPVIGWPLEKGYLGTHVQLSATAPSSDVLIRMQRGATVTGKVRHSDGTPASNIKVRLQQERMVQGRRTLRSYRMTPTDSEGTFRFGELSDGTYVLYAAPASKEFEEYRHVEVSSDEPKYDHAIT